MTGTTYDFPDPGLYFDGCRGSDEIDRLIIGLAEEYGWTGDSGDYGEDDEFLSEAADEAIDFLNSLETREGFWWGHGENAEGFGLWTAEE